MRARDYLKLLSPPQQKVIKKQMKELAAKKVRFNEEGFELKLSSKVRRRDLGVFKVIVRKDYSCNSYNPDTTIVQLNSLKNPHYNYPHPHISYNSPCLGDFFPYIAESINNGDYLHTIELIQKFLNWADDDYAFVPLEEITSKCKKCKEPIYDCFCDKDY